MTKEKKEKIDCSQPCKTSKECHRMQKKCPPDSFYGVRTNLSNGKTSLELGKTGPVVFTTDGIHVDFGGGDHLRFTDKGPQWKW